MNFGRVGLPSWEGKRVLLIGGGPSLYGFDFQRFDGPDHVFVGVNESMFDLPVCHCGVTADFAYAHKNHDRLTKFASNHELYLAIGNLWFESLEPIPNAIYLYEADQGSGLSFDPEQVCRHGTSGYLALNIAVLKGATVVIMFGYDYGNAGTTRHHYHDRYPWFHNGGSWAHWATHFRGAAESCREVGVVVINASMESAIDAFPKCSVEQALWVGPLATQIS